MFVDDCKDDLWDVITLGVEKLPAEVSAPLFKSAYPIMRENELWDLEYKVVKIAIENENIAFMESALDDLDMYLNFVEYMKKRAKGKSGDFISKLNKCLATWGY
jgi:hypothetical protein